MSESASNPVPRHKKFLRKKLLIYPKFQLTLMVVNAGIMIAAFASIGVQAARSHESLRQMGVDAHLPATHAYFRFIDFQAATLYSHLAIALIAAFALSALITLLLSHRLAGPIVRLRGYFGGIAKGDVVRPLSFRKGDFFSEVPPLINDALTRLQHPEKKDPQDQKVA